MEAEVLLIELRQMMLSRGRIRQWDDGKGEAGVKGDPGERGLA